MLGTQVFLPPFPSLPRLHSASRIIAGVLSCWETQEQDVKKSQELYKLSPAVLPEQLPDFCLLHGSAWLQAPPQASRVRRLLGLSLPAPPGRVFPCALRGPHT